MTFVDFISSRAVAFCGLALNAVLGVLVYRVSSEPAQSGTQRTHGPEAREAPLVEEGNSKTPARVGGTKTKSSRPSGASGPGSDQATVPSSLVSGSHPNELVIDPFKGITPVAVKAFALNETETEGVNKATAAFMAAVQSREASLIHVETVQRRGKQYVIPAYPNELETMCAKLKTDLIEAAGAERGSALFAIFARQPLMTSGFGAQALSAAEHSPGDTTWPEWDNMQGSKVTDVSIKPFLENRFSKVIDLEKVVEQTRKPPEK